jgi:tetratricopeptide (TPR) repeat protein
LAYACNELGDFLTAKSLLEKSLKIKQEHYGPHHYELALVLTFLRHVHNQQGDHDTAKPSLDRAFTLRANHYGPAHYQVATTMTELGHAYNQLGDVSAGSPILLDSRQRGAIYQPRIK